MPDHPHRTLVYRRSLASHHPSAFLLTAQLVSLVLYAAFEGSTRGRALLGAFGVVLLALVVWVISRSPKIWWVVWMLTIPTVLLSFLSVFFSNPILLIVSSLLTAVVYFYAAVGLIVYMLGDNRVTTDELFAAGATFTLLAWGFAYAYLGVQAWLPGSFISSTDPSLTRTFLELLFLSFTNLSATGLSDITPVAAPARVLAMLEQFSGVGFIAVVVSRLIGLTLGSRKARK